MLIGERGLAGGAKNAGGGGGHPLSTHFALNCNVGTRLGLKESKCIEITYIKHLQGHFADRSKGAGQGAENTGGSRAAF